MAPANRITQGYSSMALSKADLRGVLSGISGILVTPYDDNGDIAPAKLKPIIDRALAAGVHFPVVI